MSIRYFKSAFVVAILMAPTLAIAQDFNIAVQGGLHLSLEQSGQQGFIFAGSSFEILDASPLESEKVVKDSPFSADAVTEFVQTLSDGNRIERSFRASIARDGKGRTRREEQIALLGPLSAHGDPPTMITINDPDAGLHYTLNDETKTARRERFVMSSPNIAIHTVREGPETAAGTPFTAKFSTKDFLVNQAALGLAERVVPESSAVIENLGTQQIDGVVAEGTRTTTRIPAGSIGNQLPIDIVSERWFSKELQLAVLITRRDPRSGDTTYRLTNIVRAEPPAELFTPPQDYHLENVGDKLIDIERKKIDNKPTLVK
jgi:hypothetical protein